MEFKADILTPFFHELLEFYRHQIYESDVGKELLLKQRSLAIELHKKILKSYPELKEIVEKYKDISVDLSCYEQEQLYLQGIKDGIQIMKKIGALSE